MHHREAMGDRRRERHRVVECRRGVGGSLTFIHLDGPTGVSAASATLLAGAGAGKAPTVRAVGETGLLSAWDGCNDDGGNEVGV
jgi:hypothetical protein